MAHAPDMAETRRSFLNRLWVFLGIGVLAELLWVIGTFLRNIKNLKKAEVAS